MNNDTQKNKKLNHETGFSVIELAAVLGIVGILALGSVELLSEKKTQVQWQEADTRLSVVKASLINYAKTNKFMPCPDLANDTDGLENRNANGTCQAHTGRVPFESIGLAESNVQDSWGNYFTYAINQGAVNVAEITDCPSNSACFFNNSAPPMFDLSTLPVMGQTAATNMSGSPAGGTMRNLRVCNTENCSSSTPPQQILNEAMLVVIVAHNENGDVYQGLENAESLNKSASNFYVQAVYSQEPFYDDRLITISANELKDRYETEVLELTNGGGGGPPVNPFGNTNVPIAGGNGDNNRFSDKIGLNIESGVIEFGKENAGQMVTLTFDAVVKGGWEDADALNEGRDAQWSGGSIETQDQFVVGLNADIDEQLYTVAEGGDVGYGDGKVNLEQGLEWMGVDNDTQRDQYFYYDENDDADNTWYEYASYNAELDQDGNLKVDFAVFSTHVSESVELSNIQAVQYNAPTSVPLMPGVGYIGDKKLTEIISDGSL